MAKTPDRSTIMNLGQKMAKPRKLMFSFSSLLIASLFAFSASVQFNDPVNLVNGLITTYNIRQIAKLVPWLGLFLLFMVLVEDFVLGIAGFWSVELRERVVREKFGSGLVIISMFLHLLASSNPYNPTKTRRLKVPNYVEYGMVALVGVSFGIFCTWIKEL